MANSLSVPVRLRRFDPTQAGPTPRLLPHRCLRWATGRRSCRCETSCGRGRPSQPLGSPVGTPGRKGGEARGSGGEARRGVWGLGKWWMVRQVDRPHRCVCVCVLCFVCGLGVWKELMFDCYCYWCATWIVLGNLEFSGFAHLLEPLPL